MRFLSEVFEKAVAWVRPEKGQTLVEYALIVALISIAAIAVMILLGTEVSNTFQEIVDELT